MATWYEDVIKGLEELNGIASLSDIYKKLRAIRPLPHPESFDAIIRREIESHSSDSDAFGGKEDAFYSVDGLGGGVWGLRSALRKTPVAIDAALSGGTENPQRASEEIYRILRDTKLARQIKLLHQDTCQICGLKIKIDEKTSYSEAHHIKPLGTPHNGSDVSENIIVLCPNHHALLDYGAISLNPSNISMHPKHVISTQYISYHNENILRKQISA